MKPFRSQFHTTESRDASRRWRGRQSRAKEELELLRIKGEKQARESQENSSLLCATPFGMYPLPLPSSLEGIVRRNIAGCRARGNAWRCPPLRLGGSPQGYA